MQDELLVRATTSHLHGFCHSSSITSPWTASTNDQDDDQEPGDGGDYNLSVSEICLARWLVEENVFIPASSASCVCGAGTSWGGEAPTPWTIWALLQPPSSNQRRT